MKKTALMLADTRPALIGQMLLQIEKTNRDVFDEVIVFDTGLNDNDKALMQKLMPCRFIKYESPISSELLKRDRFKRFSLIMFARYEMFRLLNDYSLIMWMDTDMVIQGSLKELLDETAGYGFSILCEDPHNKSAKKVDYMRTNFFHAISKYNMNTYLYCTGMIIVRDCLEQSCDFTEWCYQKTLEWADNLNLPDQGVLNALTQEFKLNVKPFGNNGKYGCYPFIGRNCEDAITVHSWGTNKFWNNWYLNCKFPFWEECYREWIDMGGSTLDRTISPEISVIIPTYKPDTGYFKQCIDSLINQEQNGYESYSNYEVIIVAEPFDVEKIKEFVESYHDPRISVYFNEERLGIAASLNRGLRLARGTYIARIDDDDIAAPTRFEKQVNYLNTHPILLQRIDRQEEKQVNLHEREVWGDVVRAVCCFTIVLLHNTCNVFYGADITSDMWFSTLFVNSLTAFAVPCFYMISGAYLLRKDCTVRTALLHRVPKIYIPLIFWSCLYILTDAQMEPIQFLKMFYVQQTSHLWFVYSMVGIYILLPVLSKMYLCLDEKMKVYLVALLLLIPSLWHNLGVIAGVNLPNLHFAMFWPDLGLFFLGALLWDMRSNFQKFKWKFYALLFSTGLLIDMGMTAYISAQNGAPNSTFISCIGSFGNLFMAVAILGGALAWKSKLKNIPKRMKNWILRIGKTSMGIYFSHVLVMMCMSKLPIVSAMLKNNTGTEAEMFISAAIYFLISFVISYCGHQVPVMKKVF